MKISLSSKNLEKFQNLLKIKDQNIEISDILLTAFAYTNFIDIDDLKERINSGESQENAIKSIILDNLEVDTDLRKAFIDQVRIEKCNPSDYKNKYVELLKNSKITLGNYSLKKVTYEPYQLFALNEIDVTNNYKEISHVGYFDEKFSYMALFESKNLWMSLNPNEINTMSSTIKNASGDVLVLGLGMGYIAYMLSNSNKVKSVTVIERNATNIDLFEKFLFEKFENKTKIKIVHDDAISYIKNNNNFDYIFADLWFSPEDGLEYYLTLNEIEKEKKIKIDYWLHESLVQMKRRYMIELIKEQIDGLDASYYQCEEEIADRIFKKLYIKTKDIEIKTFEDIEGLLR